jgi:glucose/mannose-6-phosphate isomerase
MEFAEVLDSNERLRAYDPNGIMELAVRFPDQCEEAIAIFEASGFEPPQTQLSGAIVCGMGGSGIGGQFLGCIADEQGSVPVATVGGYDIPHWVGEKTWAVFVSYSGNTEETLSCYDAARNRGCPRLCITSGGELAERAERDRVQVIRVPDGQPPRTALGYLFLPLLLAAKRVGVVGDVDVSKLPQDLRDIRSYFGPDRPMKENGAKWLAGQLVNRVPLIYGLGGYRGVVATRWKGQINENAKLHAFASNFPEMNHNEIVGWTKSYTQSRAFSVVLLFDGTESDHMVRRWEVTREILDPAPVHGMKLESGSLVSRMLSMCYVGDFLSLYLAAIGETDPEKIDNINRLKDELAKLG